MNDKKLTSEELSKLIGVSLNTFTTEHVEKWINKTIEKYPEYKNDFTDVYDCIELINNPTEKTVVTRVIAKYGKKLNLTQAFTKAFDNKLSLLGDSEIWYPLFIEVRRNSKAQSIVQALTYIENNNGDIISLLEKEDDIDYYRAFVSKQPERINVEFVYKHTQKLNLSSNQNRFKDCVKLLALLPPEIDKFNVLLSLHTKTNNPYIRVDIVNQIEEHPENLLITSPIRKKTLDSMFDVKKQTVYHGEIELDAGLINEHINKTQDQVKEIVCGMLSQTAKQINNLTGLQNYGGTEKKLRYESEDKAKIDQINIITEQLKNNIEYIIESISQCNNRQDTEKFMEKFFTSITLENNINEKLSNYEKRSHSNNKLKI